MKNLNALIKQRTKLFYNRYLQTLKIQSYTIKSVKRVMENNLATFPHCLNYLQFVNGEQLDS